MGGSEAEVDAEHSKTPKLPLFNHPPMHSPERSGMVTPPLHTSASVPFGWEEEPGKPRPCTALVSFSIPPKVLGTASKGPYMGSRRMNEDFYGSFSAERGQLGTMVLSQGVGIKEKKGWFGSWRRKKAFKVKHVFPSSADKDSDDIGSSIEGSHKKVRMRKMKTLWELTNPFHAKSHVWVVS
ncbi:hypothetical protein SESBI_08241 [Sesbania bispinosa]|nr:hypothetical protein SESBI_08241 [Sesbania bispinosa]